MYITYVKNPALPVSKQGCEIAPGTVFTARVNGQGEPELWYRTHYTVTCLSNFGRTFSKASNHGGDSVTFTDYRAHKDYELIVRD